ncbi:hypothetical protein D4764_16G0007680 [Takifugu flavidus]|uniref:AT-rich interactive domain-containing protein 1B n=1 Tax=Takifugu flavidus TaxID=433684 RepID=A0A5C6P0A1_9TELE|nr:hypothetical protein D4764_16G0007680 [Takifugu flavidus]
MLFLQVLLQPHRTLGMDQTEPTPPSPVRPWLRREVCVNDQRTRRFMSNMQRNQAGSQFASPQSGPPVSPHHAPGGPVYPGMGPYSQSGPSGPYGPQGSQYGHQGNYHRPNYGGTGSTSYSGSGITNNLGMNAGSPGLGQGSGQPIPVRRNHGPGSQNRGYPTMAPISPSMPHPVGPGMGPPSLAASNRKPQELTVAANSTHSRRPPYARPSAQVGPLSPTSTHWPAAHTTHPTMSPPPRPPHPSIPTPPSPSQIHSAALLCFSSSDPTLEHLREIRRKLASENLQLKAPVPHLLSRSQLGNRKTFRASSSLSEDRDVSQRVSGLAV